MSSSNVIPLHPWIRKHQQDMSSADPDRALKEKYEKLRRHHERMFWAPALLCVLGFWLLMETAMLPYDHRTLWLSDLICGAILVIFSLLSFKVDWFWAPWVTTATGLWLLFAPLAFWTKEPAIYTQDTLIGALAIALSIVVPQIPGTALMAIPGPETPPGWSYNPSAWCQRLPLLILPTIGFLLSRYLAAFQLHHIADVWDPFFPGGTRAVLTSPLSRAWPVSDAGFGSAIYLIEMLASHLGGPTRWRSMPWAVCLFGVLTVPLGAITVVLLMLQPIVVHHWCTLCLVTAASCLLMIPLAADEFLATLQFLIRAKQNGKPLLRTFWMGGTLASMSPDRRSPKITGPLYKTLRSFTWGVSFPPTLIFSAALGIWCLFSPYVTHASGSAAASFYIVGGLAIVTSVTAWAELMRRIRYLNILWGLWLCAFSPWLLSGYSSAARVNAVIVGIALIASSIPRGKVVESYGSWNDWIS